MVLSAQSAMADVTVSGDYLKFGVGNNGSLIDFTTFTGLQYDPTGTGTFTSATDFLTPGSPFAFYSIGVGGSSATASVYGGNPFGSSTADFSLSGTTYVATSGGTYNGLKITQTITFDTTSNIIHTNVVLRNTSSATLNNLAFAVGFDPDQDSNSYGTSDTDNKILSQGVGAAVQATGLFTGYTVKLSSTGGWSGNAGVYGWNTDPYYLATAVTGNSYSDDTISLGYHFDSLAKGKEISIGYDLTVTAVPEPETYAMMLAGLGLIGAAVRRRRSA
nr:PEPxxWA-CTERM sorting domain-containing protein [Duganella flavida]